MYRWVCVWRHPLTKLVQYVGIDILVTCGKKITSPSNPNVNKSMKLLNCDLSPSQKKDKNTNTLVA
jgi:hypothetical protein